MEQPETPDLPSALYMKPIVSPEPPDNGGCSAIENTTEPKPGADPCGSLLEDLIKEVIDEPPTYDDNMDDARCGFCSIAYHWKGPPHVDHKPDCWVIRAAAALESIAGGES